MGTKRFQSGKKSLGFMWLHPFILQMEILKPRKSNLIFPRDTQNLGADGKRTSLSLEFQMSCEIEALLRVGGGGIQGKRYHFCLHLYSPGI